MDDKIYEELVSALQCENSKEVIVRCRVIKRSMNSNTFKKYMVRVKEDQTHSHLYGRFMKIMEPIILTFLPIDPIVDEYVKELGMSDEFLYAEIIKNRKLVDI